MSARSLLAIAADEIGTTEDPPGSNRNPYAPEVGHINGYPWCASFVVWCARRALIELPSESAYTPAMASSFQKAGRWVTGNPQPGDFAFFDFPDSKRRIQHVGIVESSSPTTVTCIEGNTSPGSAGSQDNGGGVYRRTRSKSHVVGYGRPDFQEDELTETQEEWLGRVHHFVEVEWPAYAKKIDQIAQHLDVLMLGVPAMKIPPVPQTVFEIKKAVTGQ